MMLSLWIQDILSCGWWRLVMRLLWSMMVNAAILWSVMVNNAAILCLVLVNAAYYMAIVMGNGADPPKWCRPQGAWWGQPQCHIPIIHNGQTSQRSFGYLPILEIPTGILIVLRPSILTNISGWRAPTNAWDMDVDQIFSTKWIGRQASIDSCLLWMGGPVL